MISDANDKSVRRLRPRAAVALPNGFTLANLFFGIFAVVSASRGEFDAAARYIVFGAIADTLDGRIARATNSGSKFGSELDSLVDAISFGTAPALIMYFLALNETRWDWIFCFFFTACAVMRLARFNVEQAGRPIKHFVGLPSPAAGLTLATYYWFSQTSLYTETVIADLPWHQMLRWVMLGLGMLMISSVQYAKVPTVGFRSLKGLLGLVLVIGTFVGVLLGLLIAFNTENIQLWLESMMGHKLFADELYFLSHLPSKVDGSEVITVVIMALGLSFLATIYPARRAAKLDPAEALRYE